MSLSTTQYGYIIDPLVPLTDDTGRTISNGYVRVFVAGSSTPVITYKNYDGATNEETIQLDNSGRTAYPVIVSKGNTYKVCVYDAEHSQESPILTIDKVVPAGANVEATNIVTGLDNVESPEAGWVKSTVSGTDAEVSLDATNVTSEVDTLAKATAASADYMMPLVHKTGSDPDKKITLGNIFKFVLNFIHSLTDTATEADLTSGNYFALDGSAGTKKLNSTTLLTKTAQNALAGNVAPAFDPTRTNVNPYKAGEKVTYNGIVKTFKVDHYGAWADADAETIQMPEFFAQVVGFTNDNFLNSIIKELHFSNLTKAQVQSIDNVIVFKNYSSLWGLVFKAGNTTLSSMVKSADFSTDLLSSSLSDGGKAIVDLSFVKDGTHPVVRCSFSEKSIDDKFSPTIKKLAWNEKFDDFGSGKYEIYGNNATNPSDLNNLKESGVYIIQRTASTTTLNFPSDFPTDASRTTLEIYNNVFDNTRNLVLQVLSSIVGYDKWWRVYNTQTAAWSGWTKISLPSLPSYVTRCIPSSEYQLYGDKVNNPSNLNSLIDNEVRIIQRTADTTTLNFPSDFPTDASRATLEVIKSKFDPSLYTSVQVLTMLTDNYQKWWRVYNHNTAVWSAWTKCNVHTGTFEFKVGTGYQYATIRSAVEAAVLIPNAKVIIYNGTYDLLTEFADKLTDVFDGSVAGVELKNGVHVIAMDGVKITANVPDDGTYTDDQLSKLGEFFNPFYSKFNNSFILENINIKATNTRYCVHDEHGGTGTYAHKYINCKMKFENTISRAGIKKYVGCIGGGLGEHGTIVIDGGRYEAHTVNGAAHIGGGDPENHQNCISYHNGNSATCNSSIRITGVYLADRGYIKFGYYGPSTIKSFCEVSGCSLGLPLVIGKEANDDAPVNYDIVSWGNEQKVEGVHWEVGVDGYTQNLVADS